MSKITVKIGKRTFNVLVEDGEAGYVKALLESMDTSGGIDIYDIMSVLEDFDVEYDVVEFVPVAVELVF